MSQLSLLIGEDSDLVAMFHQGMDNAAVFYAANPRITFAVLICCIFSIYYYKQVAKKPEFYCKDGKYRWFLLANCTQLHEKFWPTVWCFGTHAQTTLANIIRGRLPDLGYKREYIRLPDGGQVSLDWYDAPRPHFDRYCEEENKRPIALFMPGLTGTSQTEYIKSLIPNAHHIGYKAVAFNNRGRGGMKILTPKLYCAADCDDVDFTLQHLKAKYPKAKVVATGVSLGGILLCRYLIEKGEEAAVDSAMLISVCYDFLAGCESMERGGLNMALNRHLANSLISLVNEHRDVIMSIDGIDLEEVIKSTTLREFDERFTIKMYNYPRVEDYYKAASNNGKLGQIKKPTLCVNAADDMFAPHESLPIDEVENSSHVAMIVTQKGGHIGFMEGFVPMLPFYSERLSKQYLTALHKIDIQKELQ